jgi:hypothetical protein
MLATPTLGATMTDPAPIPSPSPSPSATPTAKISDAARSLALQMRAFDPHLSDGEIETIAAGIDGNLKLGKTVNHDGRALKNWNEPVTRFEVTR